MLKLLQQLMLDLFFSDNANPLQQLRLSIMCIAWPMRLIDILPDKYGIADLDGVSRRISLRLLDAPEIGDYVLVHAGYAIEKVDPLKAEEQLHIMQELKNGISASGQ